MKLCIYVPALLAGDGVPEEADKLSAETMLPIRIGEAGDGIGVDEVSVIRVPELQVCEYDPKPRVGRVHAIDYTNEFFSFGRQTVMDISGPEAVVVKPTLCEKHVVRFRPRHHCTGHYSFVIRDGQTVLLEGNFEVEG